MKVQAKEQMQKGAEQMNQIPAEARDCVKQKLGSDIFSILESGDAEKMKMSVKETYNRPLCRA